MTANKQEKIVSSANFNDSFQNVTKKDQTEML